MLPIMKVTINNILSLIIQKLSIYIPFFNKIIYSLKNNHIFTQNDKFFKGLFFYGFSFFSSSPTSLEKELLIKLNYSEQIIYDIGAYEGLFTTFFARRAKHVYAFEPNPITFKMLLKNLILNRLKNVNAYEVALGNVVDSMTLIMRTSNLATSSLEEKIGNQIKREKGSIKAEVKVFPLDYLIKTYDLSPPDFIKIDVEGMEFNVLIGMKNIISEYKPRLFIEIHGADDIFKIKNIKNIISFLRHYNYKIYHLESSSEISIENAEIAKIGRIYCF